MVLLSPADFHCFRPPTSKTQRTQTETERKKTNLYFFLFEKEGETEKKKRNENLKKSAALPFFCSDISPFCPSPCCFYISCKEPCIFYCAGSFSNVCSRSLAKFFFFSRFSVSTTFFRGKKRENLRTHLAISRSLFSFTPRRFSPRFASDSVHSNLSYLKRKR